MRKLVTRLCCFILLAATCLPAVAATDASLKQRRLEQIDRLATAMVGVPTFTQQGSALWHDFLAELRGNLFSFPLDVNDKQDEQFWNKSLATLLTFFCVCCDHLPGREQEAYDNALATKSFLNHLLDPSHHQRVSWQDVRAMLDEGEVAIELDVLPGEVLLLKHDSSSPESIPIDSVLMSKLEYYTARDPLAIDEMYAPSGPLARLWSTIEPHLQGTKAIYLSACNFLCNFNYGAIPVAQGTMVADRYDFHYLVTTAGIAQAKHAATTSFHTATLFGGVDYGTGAKAHFLPLQHSASEIHAVDSCLRAAGVATDTFTGPQATEQAFRTLSHHSADILHLSTHGFMRAPTYLNPDPAPGSSSLTSYATILQKSGLLFAGANRAWGGSGPKSDADDGILTSSEIARLDLHGTRLAVLPACKSGLGNDGNLTGAVYGPQHALKSAGVSQVLMSLWMVDDEATAQLMRYFYLGLMSGHDARTALRQAQHSLIQAGYHEPYYWAPFVLLQ